jgi:hypothetical protein
MVCLTEASDKGDSGSVLASSARKAAILWVVGFVFEEREHLVHRATATGRKINRLSYFRIHSLIGINQNLKITSP